MCFGVNSRGLLEDGRKSRVLERKNPLDSTYWQAHPQERLNSLVFNNIAPSYDETHESERKRTMCLTGNTQSRVLYFERDPRKSGGSSIWNGLMEIMDWHTTGPWLWHLV